MNKEQALLAIRDGKLVTHIYFSDGEWVTKTDDRISCYIFEDDVVVSEHDFWADRQASDWDSGWSLANKYLNTTLKEI